MELTLNVTVNVDYEGMHRRIREIINQHVSDGEPVSAIDAELIADALVNEYVFLEVAK